MGNEQSGTDDRVSGCDGWSAGQLIRGCNEGVHPAAWLAAPRKLTVTAAELAGKEVRVVQRARWRTAEEEAEYGQSERGIFLVVRAARRIHLAKTGIVGSGKLAGSGETDE